MSRRKRPVAKAVLARRASQLFFLALFVALVLAAYPRPGQPLARGLDFFFALDPLILLTTWLASHAVARVLLFSFITVAVTALFGRIFCGWFCPLGAVHAIASWVATRLRPRIRRKDHWTRGQLAKYYILIVLVVMALFGSQWLTFFDPIALLYRSTATALLPAAQWVAEDASTAIYQADPGVGPVRLTALTEPVYKFVRDRFFVTPHQSFLQSGWVLAFFLGTVLLNLFRRRFWCRYVCPLGGLLGLVAWRPLVRRKVQTQVCNQCDLCGMSCHGASSTGPGEGWKAAECLGCMNCTDTCPSEGVGFEWIAPWQRESGGDGGGVDLTRRGVLAATVAGVAGLCLMRTSPQARGKVFHPDLIRPPGALAERDFLERCIACGACMKVCPTGGLQPVAFEAGLEGVWTPKLTPRIGYCEYDCNRCGQVCPTHAIAPLPLEEKQQTRLGLAGFDRSRCLPWAYNEPCLVCEEHCPVPAKAIYLETVTVTDRFGNERQLDRPHVDPALCIGCGICENVCPFKDRPAIRVTSANESRHEGENQPILPAAGSYY